MSAAAEGEVRPDRSRGEALRGQPTAGPAFPGAIQMLDVIMLAVGLGFFVVAWAYVAGCDRL